MIKLLIITISFFDPMPKDSLGTETINGKLFVIHKVAEKETLYGISKRYGATVDAVLEYNPAAKTSLAVGQILKVPYTKRTTKTTTSASTGGGGVVHVVTQKETLFSISKAYGVSVDELKEWNNLTTTSLTLGQELTIKKRNTAVVATTPVTIAPTQMKSRNGVHTVGPKETLFSISRLYNISVTQLKEWNSLQDADLTQGQVLFVTEPERSAAGARQSNTTTQTQATNTTTNTKNQDATVATRDVKDNKSTQPKESVITITEGVKGSDEIVESGLAELIDGTDGNRKYLALHRTAPVGTILKLKNEMNNREVFVRVMGKLPDTALTDKVAIRISKSAYDRLGAIDQRFRVQITYYK